MGLEILDGLSTGLRCLLKRSLSRRLVFFYFFGVTVNMMSDRSSFACRVECV